MPNDRRTILLSAVTSVVISSLMLAGGLYGNRSTDDPGSVLSTTDTDGPVSGRQEEESPIIDVVRETEPAVVSVVITKDLPVIERYYERVPLGDSPFSIRVPRTRQLGTERQEVGGGTAFFISSDGLLITNRHVVSDEEAQYSVILNNGETLDATVLARDVLSDIALLQVDGTGFTYVELSSAEEPVLGQTVIAIGNALAEFRNTVSVGVISGLQRTITAGNPSDGTAERLSRIIQTDAAINEGNSGGPLLDLEGRVIGMNTAIASEAQNIGFAIPVSDLSRVLQSYQRYGRIVRPYLGVRYVSLTEELARDLSLSSTYGVQIASGNDTLEAGIIPGSPAERAGIREGDIILEADGQKLTPDVSLGDIIQRKQPGDDLTLLIVRGGEEQELTVELEEWKDS